MTDEAPRRGRPRLDAETAERPDLRADIRPDDSRARAEARAAQLREHLADAPDGSDDFYIPDRDIPDGWTYEWKRKTILGAEDPAYNVQISRAGWEAVPADRHPEYMPMDGKWKHIERKGMVLMERPKAIVDDARKKDLRSARDQVRMKEEQLNGAPDGQFERRNKDDSLVKVKKSYEPMVIPD